MKALVVYESMYGNTHEIAEAIAEGLGEVADVRLVPVSEATEALVDKPDLVVVGGPTHVHGMSRAGTRKAAIADADKPGRDLTVDPGADGPGVRDFLDSIGALHAKAAAFDTRLRARAWLTGRASKGIARGLRQRGCSLVAGPESFLVTKDNVVVTGEAERARQWGTSLGRTALAEGASDDAPSARGGG
jgi:hypothetical protein